MNLKKELKDRNYTQSTFANKAKVTQENVSYWCSKEWHKLNYSTREKICKSLGVEVC